MEERGSKVNYDDEEDVLYYNSGSPAAESLKVGDYFVEMDDQGNVVGLEVLRASENIEMQTSSDVSREDLEELVDADISATPVDNSVFIVLDLIYRKGGDLQEQKLNVNVGTGEIA